MNNIDLQQNFEYLVQALNNVYCITKDLIEDTNKTILSHDINLEKNYIDIRNLEKFLFYLDYISFQINDMINDSHNIEFINDTKNQKFNNTCNKNNLLILPIYPDKDIYVEPGETIFDIIKKKDKNKPYF